MSEPKSSFHKLYVKILVSEVKDAELHVGFQKYVYLLQQPESNHPGLTIKLVKIIMHFNALLKTRIFKEIVENV